MNRSRIVYLPLLVVLLAGAWLMARRPAEAAAIPATPDSPLARVDTYTQTPIDPSDPDAANFGAALVAQDDLMAVGAYFTEINGLTAGKVFLFRPDDQSPSGWTEFRTLQADTPQAQGHYGESVALQGDTLVIGEPWDGTIKGAVSVYERNQGGPDQWGFVVGLADETVGKLRFFGQSLAIDGDLIAVGAPGAGDRGLNEAGKAYLYSRAAGWARIKDFSDPTGQERDHFGWAVALQGDTLVVGANDANADASNGNTGVVFVYDRNQGGPNRWGQVARLVTDTPKDGAGFGHALALEGDTLVVSAYIEDREVPPGTFIRGAGAVFVFGRNEGGPNAWGRVAALRPDNPPLFESFGSSLALNGDDLWVGAEGSARGGGTNQGALFRFSRNEGGSNAWGQMDMIIGDNTTRYSNFGSAVAMAGDRVLVGADGAGGVNGKTGHVYAITVDEEAATTSFPVLLPVAAFDWAPPVGTLEDGGSVAEPSGAIVGAVPGTLDAPTSLTIVNSNNALSPLPTDFVPRGATYRVSAGRQVIAPADKPFLVGLPVPAGTDVTKLAVATHLPNGLTTEDDQPPDNGRSWSAVPGSYDPATNLFVITLRALLPEGISVVLFEHPENVPLPSPPTATSRTAQAVEYNVICDPAAANTGVCNRIRYAEIGNELESAHNEFVNTYGFKAPAMVHLIGAFTAPGKDPVLSETYYGAMIASTPCIDDRGQNILGQYSYLNMQLLICIDENAPSDQITDTVRHELFHAVQASYSAVADDYLDDKRRPLSQWTLEGTALAAEESGQSMERQTIGFALHMATVPITSTVETMEYEAQDFWVYTGLEGPQSVHSLAYLKAVFEKGATPEHVDLAMDLGDNYWQWAKNQVIEHHQTMFGSFSRGACEVDLDAVGVNNIKVLSYPETYFVEGRLPPLTSAVVVMRSSIARANMPISAHTSGEPRDFKYKAYEAEGTPGCQNLPDGSRFWSNVPAGGERFVLVSNLSLDETIDYDVETD